MVKNSKYYLPLILVLAATLRLWNINSVPVSLYSDEVDLGYQAYSILKTGKDYFGNPWPLNFHSYADYRTPFNIYITVPFVFLFGITPLGIRLPSVIFGVAGIYLIYLVVKEIFGSRWLSINKNKKWTINNQSLAITASFMLAISPWHIQYSRVTLEVSALILFLLSGIFLFYKSLKNSKLLILSVIFLSLTPYIYSTAKFFTPLFVISLLLLWRKEILGIYGRKLIFALLTGLIISLPIYSSVIFGKGAERAKYTSVFSDPTISNQVLYQRTHDATVRGDLKIGYTPKLVDKVFHNKLNVWWEKISSNILNSVASDFLFVEGDPNLRHSPGGVGQFYQIESIAFIFGVILFFSSRISKKTKALIFFWILLGVLTSSITREGGNHATRLILILPPLVILVSIGIAGAAVIFEGKLKTFLITAYFALLATNILFYLHEFHIHYPLESERWWNSGYKEMVYSLKSYDSGFDKVVISISDEPPEIFLAAYYPIEPAVWQKGLKDGILEGFGNVKNIGKFYFGKYPEFVGVGSAIDTKTIYVASANETKANLFLEPEKKPDGIKILQVVRYHSGDPAFYLLTKE